MNDFLKNFIAFQFASGLSMESLAAWYGYPLAEIEQAIREQVEVKEPK